MQTHYNSSVSHGFLHLTSPQESPHVYGSGSHWPQQSNLIIGTLSYLIRKYLHSWQDNFSWEEEGSFILLHPETLHHSKSLLSTSLSVITWTLPVGATPLSFGSGATRGCYTWVPSASLPAASHPFHDLSVATRPTLECHEHPMCLWGPWLAELQLLPIHSSMQS